MKQTTIVLAGLMAVWSGPLAAHGSTNLMATNRVLMIDPSSMPVAGGQATLTIGQLQWTNGVYSGDYKIQVSPYFFKNEKGRLAINVSDESVAEIALGKTTAITGTATTSGKGGARRPIGATATPADVDHGTIKLWFTAGDREMIFEPAYHFAEDGTAAAVAKPTETNRTVNLPRRLPNAYREALEVNTKHP